MTIVKDKADGGILESDMSRRHAIGLLATGLGGVLHGVGCTGAAPLAQRSTGSVAFARNVVIRTALNDVSPDALASGATLFHEHLSITPPRSVTSGSSAAAVTDNVEVLVQEVVAAGKNGVRCIVDAGGRDLGRKVETLRELARRTDVQIVVGGGYWTQTTYPPEVAKQTVDEIAEGFIRDSIAERWGVIGEIGWSKPTTPDERKVLRAAIRAHRRTGLSLMTHNAHDGCRACAAEQFDLLMSEGVDPSRVCIGHLSDVMDDPRAETAIAIAKRGGFVGFDTVGHKGIGPAEPEKVAMLLAVLKAGYEDRVLLSSDMLIFTLPDGVGRAGYATVMTTVLPKLREAGVAEATIKKMTVDNPRRFLAFVPKATGGQRS